MITKVIKNIEEFEAIEKHWNNLHKTINGTIFQSYYWNYKWWQIYKRQNTELSIITIWENEELVGLLPLFLEQIKIGPFKFNRTRLLCVYQAYGEYEPLVDPNYRELVINEFVKTISSFFKEGKISWSSFYGFPINSDLISNILKILKHNGYLVIHKPKIVTRVIMELPDSWDKYLNLLTQNEKTMLNRRIKSLQKKQVKLEVLKNQEIKKKDFEDFVYLHTVSWESKGYPGFFKASENFKNFLESIIIEDENKNIRKLYFFSKDDKRFAAVLAFFSYPNCYFYLSGMEQSHEMIRYSPGKVLLSYVIKDAINENYKIFDFQGGKETYKYQLGGKTDYYSKADIFNKTIQLPLLITLHYLLQFRQLIITIYDYNKFLKWIRKTLSKLKNE